MAAQSDEKFCRILGIKFFTGSPREAADIGLRGGLVVVPAGPALVELPQDDEYRKALLESDLAIADSGLMVLVWKILTRKGIQRISGLAYLQLILDEPSVRAPHGAFWVMPTASSLERNLAWLQQHGHATTSGDSYLAPHYSSDVTDPALVQVLEKKRPAHVIIAIGGGTQEKLGAYLKRRLTYRPAIHCIGAAIGFLSGDQVNIPKWADYFFLGWLFRTLSEPSKFLPRYWKARKLIPLMMKNRDRLPL